MINKIQSKNAITLISLVITVIVLLILTGVTLSMLTGENGILVRAKTARKQHQSGREEEENRLAGIENVMGKYLGVAATTAISDSTHYGDYFDLGTEILGTITNGTYSSSKTLEGESIAIKADWRIFSRDNNGVWLILADYLPINESEMNIFITGTETDQIGLKTFSRR